MSVSHVKPCSKCRKNERVSHQRYCRECKNAYQQGWRARKRAAVEAWKAEYFTPENILARMRRAA